MTLREIAMHCKIKQSEQEADKYKQQSDLYESVLTGDVTEFVVPENWTNIRTCAFRNCQSLSNVILHNNITHINFGAFFSCTSLTNITLPNKVVLVADNAFNTCRSLTSINLPSSVTRVANTTFIGCKSLTNVTLGNNFNCNNLDLSASTNFSVDTLVAMLTALADRSNQSAYTLTLGATNLAKLSDEQKAIATDKNWTLA
ncbi:MAG: leucine-rich repeat domain-containing protein [Candidatus Pseudoruminococcus sp.]|nr:leucine-rich repeat domain-containing protein [Ruminococcus sp.]MDY2782633.1 leucine-rich repeat domain-containing protein [Candidatus Pseudoruminococcus sp.]